MVTGIHPEHLWPKELLSHADPSVWKVKRKDRVSRGKKWPQAEAAAVWREEDVRSTA